MVRTYGKPPYTTFAIHGGPGAKGSLGKMAREIGEFCGIIEPFQSEYSINGLLSELDRQIQTASFFPVTLVGHSWGAWLSILYAGKSPADYISGLRSS